MPGQAAAANRKPRHDPAHRSSGRARAAGRAVGRAGLGAVLHRALREPDLGRLLGVPVPDLDRADRHRQRLGRAGHAEPRSSPICLCGSPIPRIGLSLGVWEPARLVDATRAPWCFPTSAASPSTPACLPGAGAPGRPAATGPRARSGTRTTTCIPLLSWIGVLLDLGCLEGGGLDIAWASELDPAWLDDELTFLLNPEAALFANLPAQAACAADCAAASAGLPLDPLFWCAGCQGGMYPLTGNVAAHVGRRAGFAARLPAPALPAPPRRARLGNDGLGRALRALSDADHEEVAVPLADDPAGPGDRAR